MSRAFKLDTAGGLVWEFNDPTCPLFLRSDPTGIEGAPFDFDDQKNVGQAGVTYRDRNDEPNLIGMDIRVGPVPKGPDAQELLQRVHNSFGRGKHIHTFHSITDYGGDRTQLVRLASVPALSGSLLTKMRDHGEVFLDGVTFRSDETWFRKKPVVKSFIASEFATAKIRHESLEPVWPHFSITGPISNPTIGVAGEAVPLPSIGAGQTWTIETDPDFFDIRDHLGVDRSWVLRYWHVQAPAAQPGKKIDVPVTITGTGTTASTKVTVTLPQLFWSGV